MLRITESSAEDGHRTLYLEGQIFGPWLSELRRCCDRLLEDDRQAIVDLAAVSFLDRDAVNLLIELNERGIDFVNCTPFVAEQLKAGQCLTSKRNNRPRPSIRREAE
jgi:ABC-type transporter Mla MlaB component